MNIIQQMTTIGNSVTIDTPLLKVMGAYIKAVSPMLAYVRSGENAEALRVAVYRLRCASVGLNNGFITPYGAEYMVNVDLCQEIGVSVDRLFQEEAATRPTNGEAIKLEDWS